MSNRALLITFIVVFTLGLFLIVALPFLFREGPTRRLEERAEEPAPAERGVFRSEDRGRTWVSKSRVRGGGSIADFRVNRIVQDPVASTTIYLLADGNGLWVSRDRGEAWEQVVDRAGVLEARSNLLGLAVNPSNPREWYVAVFQRNRGRVLLSRDRGETFLEIYFTPLERFGVFDIHYDRSRGVAAIVTGQGGYLETADQGRTWRVIRWFADGLVRLLVDPRDPSARFAASRRGSLFRTRDAGVSWEDVTPALQSFARAAEDQRWFMDRSGTIYLGSRYGLLRSRSAGATFEAPPLIIPPEALPILSIGVDPAASSRIVVSALNQLYESTDDGRSWAILPPPAAGRVTHLLIDRSDPDRLYAVVEP